jgi:hypothetical protein
LAIAFAIFAGAQAPTIGPDLVPTSVSFSGTGWSGFATINAEYSSGFISASTGDLSGPSDPHSMCNASSNGTFGNSATALDDSARFVHAYWFLTAYQFAQDVCGLDLSFCGGAYCWGLVNADRFVSAIESSTYEGNVISHVADVEYCFQWTSSPVYCGECFQGQSGCADSAYWDNDTVSTNRQVIDGFLDGLNDDGIYTTGVYSSIDMWNGITDGATSAELDKLWFWFADWSNPTQAELNSTARIVRRDWDYSILSWQYATADVCQIDTVDAKDLADAAQPRVFTIDLWVLGNPNAVC